MSQFRNVKMYMYRFYIDLRLTKMQINPIALETSYSKKSAIKCNTSPNHAKLIYILKHRKKGKKGAGKSKVDQVTGNSKPFTIHSLFKNISCHLWRQIISSQRAELLTSFHVAWAQPTRIFLMTRIREEWWAQLLAYSIKAFHLPAGLNFCLFSPKENGESNCHFSFHSGEKHNHCWRHSLKSLEEQRLQHLRKLWWRLWGTTSRKCLRVFRSLPPPPERRNVP